MAGFFVILSKFKMKIAVFIDGSNFYSKLKELKIKHTSQFDYNGFILSLTKGTKPMYVGYYVGQVRKEKNNPKSELLYSHQQKLFAHLQANIPDIKIVRGHIQNYNGIYKEKGVDVRLALDLYSLAIENTYDKAILISSDSDLVPAVRMVQARNKEVEYIGFSHNTSMALIKECKSKRLLNFDDVYSFSCEKNHESSNL